MVENIRELGLHNPLEPPFRTLHTNFGFFWCSVSGFWGKKCRAAGRCTQIQPPEPRLRVMKGPVLGLYHRRILTIGTGTSVQSHRELLTPNLVKSHLQSWGAAIVRGTGARILNPTSQKTPTAQVPIGMKVPKYNPSKDCSYEGNIPRNAKLRQDPKL